MFIIEYNNKNRNQILKALYPC